jgi:hypothetical protein
MLTGLGGLTVAAALLSGTRVKVDWTLVARQAPSIVAAALGFCLGRTRAPTAVHRRHRRQKSGARGK